MHSVVLCHKSFVFAVCSHSSQHVILHCVKDYWSQPARHIIRRYQQCQQQQQALTAFSDATDDSHVLMRSLQLYTCGYPGCGKQFNQKHNLQRHQTRKHSRAFTPRHAATLQLHTCGYPSCGKQFTQKRNLQRHETQKHGRTPTQVSLQLHKCNYADCEKRFSQKRNLQRHQRLKHDCTPLHLNTCN